MFPFSGSDTPSALILLLFLDLPTQCCQKHLYLLPSPHTPLLSCSVSETGPLSAYLSAPIISKLQSCSDFQFSCLTATPSCTVLSMESSAILPHFCNIPSSASFPFAHSLLAASCLPSWQCKQPPTIFPVPLSVR